MRSAEIKGRMQALQNQLESLSSRFEANREDVWNHLDVHPWVIKPSRLRKIEDRLTSLETPPAGSRPRMTWTSEEIARASFTLSKENAVLREEAKRLRDRVQHLERVVHEKDSYIAHAQAHLKQGADL